MKEVVLREIDIVVIKTIIKLICCFIISLNLDNYNFVIFMFMLMAFI